jgi:hypothetical protein
VRQVNDQCHEPVPAESIEFIFGKFGRHYSANGDRQILPKQTIKIFMA